MTVILFANKQMRFSLVWFGFAPDLFSVATKWKTKVGPAGQLMVKISTKPNLYTLPKWLATIALTN